MNIKLIEKELKEFFDNHVLYDGRDVKDLIEEYFNALKHDKR